MRATVAWPTVAPIAKRNGACYCCLHLELASLSYVLLSRWWLERLNTLAASMIHKYIYIYIYIYMIYDIWYMIYMHTFMYISPWRLRRFGAREPTSGVTIRARNQGSLSCPHIPIRRPGTALGRSSSSCLATTSRPWRSSALSLGICGSMPMLVGQGRDGDRARDSCGATIVACWSAHGIVKASLCIRAHVCVHADVRTVHCWFVQHTSRDTLLLLLLVVVVVVVVSLLLSLLLLYGW